MFRDKGEPDWPRMDLFLNGDKRGRRVSLIDALDSRLQRNLGWRKSQEL
jgi:hypothetical protein